MGTLSISVLAATMLSELRMPTRSVTTPGYCFVVELAGYPFAETQPSMGRGRLLAMEFAAAPLSSAGPYTAKGLMEEPTGMFADVARLSSRNCVGGVREPTTARTSPLL